MGPVAEGNRDAVDVPGRFKSSRGVVPALKEHSWMDERTVRVVVQYEPPNSGGGRGDLDRIVARAARHLGCEWARC